MPAEESACEPEGGRAIGGDFHGFATVLLGTAEGLLLGFWVDLLEEHYVSGFVGAEDLGIVPVQLQAGRAGDEPVVLDFFEREMAHFRGIVLRATCDGAIAKENVR